MRVYRPTVDQGNIARPKSEQSTATPFQSFFVSDYRNASNVLLNILCLINSRRVALCQLLRRIPPPIESVHGDNSNLSIDLSALPYKRIASADAY